VLLGDGRISLEREAATGHLGNFDVLVLDAFSSDSIPVHLLTEEAMALYLRHLRGVRSVLAFHISNRSVDLKPVIFNLAQRFGFSAIDVEGGKRETDTSEWVLLSRDPTVLQVAPLEAAGKPLRASANIPLWTDDFSNLVQVLR
jgi:hypothetical protein